MAHALGPRDAQRRRKKRLGVADDADFDGIVAADLFGVDVDLDQPGRRNVVDVALEPRAGMQIVEARADREDHIGVARRLGRRKFAPHARDAEMQAMVVGQRALAHERRVDGNVELLGERLAARRRRG